MGSLTVATVGGRLVAGGWRRQMRVGISLTSSHAVTDVREGARWMIERAAAAQAAGLDSLFIGDHHAMPVPYYQNVPMLGRLLAEWGDRPAGCLFLLPLWHPVLLAEQVGTLAAIHRGPFIMQCALGDDRGQFGAFGVSLRTRRQAFEACLDVARRLWAGETVSLEEPWRIQGAKIAPVPPEPVDVWIGGAVEPSVDRAARLGEGFIAAPHHTAEEAGAWSAYYLERCTVHGRAPKAVAVRRDIYVAESDAAAAAVVEPILAAGYRGFRREALVFGSPETVAREFRALGATGYTDVIVRHVTNEQSQVLNSIRLLNEVRAAVA